MLESAEVVVFWCHDCSKDSLFEVVVGGAEQIPREWACTTCGAACIEAFDVASQIEADVRGVA
jgi:hypothetical protein